MNAASGAAPPAASITALTDGAANPLQGQWPDRVCAQPQRAELHHFAAPGKARAQALVYAGGGYLQLVHDKEGVQVAQWLNGLGIDAHVLVHRLPGQRCDQGGVWPFDIALQDGLLALRHLAGLAGLAGLAVEADHAPLPLFHVGLSSGGHLAGVMACQPHPAPLQACGAVIGYAPLNANHRAYKAPAGKPDYPPPQKQAFYDAWPVGIASEVHGMPRCPVFLAYALHDAVVPVQHALNVMQSAQKAGADVEAHVFAQAPHGFALRDLAGTHDQWPALAARWMVDRLHAGAHPTSLPPSTATP